MSIPDTSDLLDSLKFRVHNPETQALLEHLAADVTRVAALALTDPTAAEPEIAILKASVANLTSTEQIAVQSAVTHWLTRVALGVVKAAFA